MKEQAHDQSAPAKLQSSASPVGPEQLERKLAEIAADITGVESREATNTRAGYVYVISNIGAFGERMVKIGMTRRLEP